MSEEDLEDFHASAVEFVFEQGVGMTVYAHAVQPFLSWEETKQFSNWLAEQIKNSEEPT